MTRSAIGIPFLQGGEDVKASRLDRLGFDHAGDVEPVGQGISELRIHYGPRYRICFHKRGDKSTQEKDIKAAKRLAAEWSELDDRKTDHL